MPGVSRRVLPGFGLSLGYTLAYHGLLVLIPLGACFLKASSLSLSEFWAVVWTDRARAAYVTTFTSALVAAAINVFLGLIVGWTLVRYEFPLKRLVDGLVDLPFALPTAVAGICLTAVYAPNGWIGQHLEPHGIKVAYTPLGVVVALTFIGVPFVVRTVQPVLQDLDAEVEEAAASLGANRWQTFRQVLWPPLLPALLTGFALALARALGEYGSVVFVSGNRPFRTEIAPVLIVARLEEYAYAEATALAVVLLALSFALLVAVNLLERGCSSLIGPERSEGPS